MAEMLLRLNAKIEKVKAKALLYSWEVSLNSIAMQTSFLRDPVRILGVFLLQT